MLWIDDIGIASPAAVLIVESRTLLSANGPPAYNRGMFNAIVLWIHVFAATTFIGPQVFLFMVAMPAIRTIDDARQRASLTRAITRGFGVLGGASIAVLLVTGIINYYHAKDLGLIEFKRYFIALQIKLTLVVVVLILTTVHGAVLGRRLQRLQEEGAPEAEVAKTRRLSMWLSAGNLAASIIILLCAAILASDWSKLGALR